MYWSEDEYRSVLRTMSDYSEEERQVFRSHTPIDSGLQKVDGRYPVSYPVRWAPIDEEKFPGYMISNFGTVWNPKRREVMKGSVEKGILCMNILGARMRPHNAVGNQFVPNDDPDRKTFIVHLDDNQMNMDFDNLHWATLSEQRLYQQHHVFDLEKLPEELFRCVCQMSEDCCTPMEIINKVNSIWPQHDLNLYMLQKIWDKELGERYSKEYDMDKCQLKRAHKHDMYWRDAKGIMHGNPVLTPQKSNNGNQQIPLLYDLITTTNMSNDDLINETKCAMDWPKLMREIVRHMLQNNIPKTALTTGFKVFPVRGETQTIYGVNDLGVLKNFHTNQITLGRVNNDGYASFELTDTSLPQSQRGKMRVSRAVAMAFVKNPYPDKYDQVDHIDHVPLHNWASNLQWLDNSGQMLREYQSGRLVAVRGEQQGGNKFTTEQIHHVCRLLQDTKIPLREVAERAGVTFGVVNDIFSGRNWVHVAKMYDIHKRGHRQVYSIDQLRQVCELLQGAQHTYDQISEITGVGYVNICGIYNRTVNREISKDYDFSKPIPKARVVPDEKVHAICKMFFNDGMTRREIANELGYPKGYVKHVLAGYIRTDITSQYGVVPKEKPNKQKNVA